LAAGHAVGQVVDDDGGDVQVAPGGVDQVVAADGRGVAVAHDHDDLELGVGQLHAGGESERSAVGGVERIEIHVHAETPGTVDAGDQNDLVLGETRAVNGPDQRAQDNAVPAPRTPDMGELLLVAQVLINELGEFGHFSSQHSAVIQLFSFSLLVFGLVFLFLRPLYLSKISPAHTL